MDGRQLIGCFCFALALASDFSTSFLIYLICRAALIENYHAGCLSLQSRARDWIFMNSFFHLHSWWSFHISCNLWLSSWGPDQRIRTKKYEANILCFYRNAWQMLTSGHVAMIFVRAATVEEDIKESNILRSSLDYKFNTLRMAFQGFMRMMSAKPAEPMCLK